MITITEKEFKQLSQYIKEHYGIYLKDEKRALVTGRLQNVLVQNGFHDFTEYFNYILSDKTGNAMITLVNKITTNHTFFMRESDHFYFLRDHILPNLINTVKEKDLRIWSAGCSSGEEPYILAMINDEYLGKEKLLWDTKILATDISERVLEEARNGVYSSEEVENLSSQWKLNYFKKQDEEHYRIVDKIKSDVIFRKFNLMDDVFPFKRKFQVIFCRNVMIYFDTETKQRLVNKFYEALENGGYLFIGHSESINRGESKFKYILPAVYRKE
jgi:chemotaxis protein methyltransferase CheR